MNNFCLDCIEAQTEKDNIIYFHDIKIENKKILQLLEKINNHNDYNNDKDTQFIINDNSFEKSPEYEENGFEKLINIIINDYKMYPNFSHFFNIKNLLHFFNIEDYIVIEKEQKKIGGKLIKKNEPIIIEYINNYPYKTKLFSKIFVKNNKKKFKIEIEGKILDLIDEYEFKRKNKKERIKLFTNNRVSEINLYKMFENCINLIYVDGISKLNKLKIININKLFYNCINLSSIPDFNEFEIQNYNPYLIFYNCISLTFFLNEKKLKINNYGDGIIITKYLKYNQEIIINNIIEDDEGYINNLFRYKFKIENEEVMIFDGKDELELIACYKDEQKRDKDNLNSIYQNGGNRIKLKFRIINKTKDMNGIIINNELDLTKWNLRNVTNIEYLFSNCEFISILPNISKWNTKNVKSMKNLFDNCKSLSSLPDISKWNINNVINMIGLFYNCLSLSSLPDISKWNTNKVINIKSLFYNCLSLLFFSDIKKWYKNKIPNIKNLFNSYSSFNSLSHLSDHLESDESSFTLSQNY